MQQKRVFFIHGWGGAPEEGWRPWLKEQLEAKGFTIINLSMPDTDYPQMNKWVTTLRDAVISPDKNCYFVGHSIGCQTILRYLESLPENIKVGGAVFVAGWTILTSQATPDEETRAIAKPWIETPIDWAKVKGHTNNFIAIFSDNDPYVSLNESEVFKDKIGAKIITLTNKGHFSGDDGITELPVALDAILQLAQL